MVQDSDKTDEANRHRPWYRLHLSTWLFALLVTAVLVLLVVPGESWEVSSKMETFEHGWPWLHLQRTIANSPRPLGVYDDVPWLYREAWGLAVGVTDFSPSKLVGNAAIALLILVVAAAGFEWWRRRRRRLWQFSLRELLVVTLLVAIALSWWQCHRQRVQLEQRAVATTRELLSVAGDYDPMIDEYYCGPKWLAKLVGTKPLGVLYAVTSVGFYSINDAQLQQVRPCLESWHYVETLCLHFSYDEVTDEGLECISRMTSLQRFYVCSAPITDEGLVHLSPTEEP